MWPQLLCLCGILALGFSLWGTKTAAGRRTFDEMAGMIPLAAGAVGVLLLVGGSVWLLLRARS